MHSRNNSFSRQRRLEPGVFDSIPIECIRKTRKLNVDNTCCHVSREIYKILKSSNGRKLFA
ncbi:MAG: hypothetical protein ABH848_03700 [Candidatus Omnitrophota bacterium]